MPAREFIVRLILALTLGTALAAPAVAASKKPAKPKTDVVVFTNGDRLTGEIKKLSRGVLSFKTIATDTIPIKWEDVETISSDLTFEVETSTGDVYFGSLGSLEDSDDVVVHGMETVALRHSEVVIITRIKETFWGRVDGYLSLGYNFTQASDLTQISLATDIKYRAKRFLTELSYDGLFTRQPGRNDSQRQNLSGLYQQFLRRRWFAIGSLAFQQNDELGIRFRALPVAGMGRHVIFTNRSVFDLAAGLAGNREDTFAASEVRTSLEGIIYAAYSLFRYKYPKADINTNLSIFPSLTESGRTRVEFNLKLRHEIVKDFFIDLTFWESHDSRPPDTAGAKNDLAVILSLGWTF